MVPLVPGQEIFRGPGFLKTSQATLTINQALTFYFICQQLHNLYNNVGDMMTNIFGHKKFA